MADTRLMVGVIGSPKGTELAEEVRALVRHLGRSEPVDGIATRLLANLEQLVADLVDRRIPRHARPLPIYELHRITQPPLTVNEFAHGSTLRAMRAAIDRRFPARLLSHPHPVQHFRRHCAPDGTMRADTLADGGTRGKRTRGCGFHLAKASERQRTQGGQTASDNARPAQKCAAIQTAGLA